jgi:hypothetical protein
MARSVTRDREVLAFAAAIDIFWSLALGKRSNEERKLNKRKTESVYGMATRKQRSCASRTVGASYKTATTPPEAWGELNFCIHRWRLEHDKHSVPLEVVCLEVCLESMLKT